MDDWRRQGQEKFLFGTTLIHQKYVPYSERWEHDHCSFCYRKLSVAGGDVDTGYCTTDQYYWICEECFADFRHEFQWTVRK